MNTEFMLTFIGAVVTMMLAHPVADYFVQTDHQAQHKGLTGHRSVEGRVHCAAHAFTYTLTQNAILCTVFALADFDGRYAVVVLALVLNGVTHYVIDRRWPLEAFARATAHGGWIDRDPEAMPKLDQAAHLALFLPVGLLIAAFA